MTRQSVVLNRLPRRGVGDEGADTRPDPRIAVERAHADTDRLRVAEVATEDRRAALAAEPFLATVVGLPALQAIRALDDVERARRRVRAGRRRGATAPLTPGA